MTENKKRTQRKGSRVQVHSGGYQDELKLKRLILIFKKIGNSSLDLKEKHRTNIDWEQDKDIKYIYGLKDQGKTFKPLMIIIQKLEIQFIDCKEEKK